MCESYNGWPNRETWAVALHIDNDPGTYEYRCELLRESDGVGQLADLLEGFVTDLVEPVFHDPENATDWGRMCAADVGSFYRVDWWKIAEGFWSEREDDDQ